MTYGLRLRYYLFSIILSFVFLLNAFSQTITFNRMYDYEGWTEPLGAVVVTNDGGYLASGSFSTYTARHAYMIRTNQYGDTLWTMIHGKAPKLYQPTSPLIKTSDSCYVISGFMQDSAFETNSDAWFIKFNDKGEVLWEQRYGGDGDDEISLCKQTKDGGYIASGLSDSFNGGASLDAYLVRTDSVGNLLWQKTYGKYGTYEIGTGAGEIIETEDGGFLFIVGYWSCDPTINHLYKVDSIGNVLWIKDYNNLCALSIKKMKREKGYLVSGIYGDTVINAGDKLYPVFFLKLNETGDIIWEKPLNRKEKLAINNFYELPDSSGYVLMGWIDAKVVNQWGNDNVVLGWIAKLDTGRNIMWEHKFYTNIFYSNYIYDGDITTDGGFILAGSAEDSLNKEQNAWLVKLDSMGCLVAGCDTINDSMFEIPLAKSLLNIYPNPLIKSINSTVTIHYNFEKLIKEGEIILMDVFGKKHYSCALNNVQQGYSTINASALNCGVYFLQLKGNNVTQSAKKLIVVK